MTSNGSRTGFLDRSRVSRIFRRLERLSLRARLSKTEDILEQFGSIGTGVEVSESIELQRPERIVLGNYVYVGPNTLLDGRGKLTIHDHVIISYEVAVLTSSHNHKSATMVPYDAVELLKPVTIEQSVWIGMRAIIMPGVTLGEGSVVGAGAVVTKSCQPGSILGGNPAQVIGERDMNQYYACVKQEQFYLKQKQALGFAKQERFI